MATDNTTFHVEPNGMPNDVKSSPSRWKRGLYMLIFVILFSLGQSVLTVIALFQFLSLVVSGKSNLHLTRFGKTLALWLKATAEFQTCATEDKPFPWTEWPTDSN